MKKVLVLGTSRKTRGGITSVIKAHQTGSQWHHYRCHWIETHRDGPVWMRMAYFISGMCSFMARLPFYDIVHIHMSDHVSGLRKSLFARVAKIYGKKIIVHLHSCDPSSSISGKYRNVYRYPFTHADKVIALSETWMEEIRKAFDIPEKKIEVLYNPCPEVCPSDAAERESYILFAGIMTHRKGYDDLIRAFAMIAGRFPSWRLKLAGNGEMDRARDLARELGIGGRVDLLGWVTGEEKDKTFRHASIYCLPSYCEGFPMSVLEAWAYHLPVVTTAAGGLRDAVSEGRNALVCEPGNIPMLAEKLSALISDTALRDALSRKAAGTAVSKFGIRTICANLHDIYSGI